MRCSRGTRLPWQELAISLKKLAETGWLLVWALRMRRFSRRAQARATPPPSKGKGAGTASRRKKRPEATVPFGPDNRTPSVRLASSGVR